MRVCGKAKSAGDLCQQIQTVYNQRPQLSVVFQKINNSLA